MRRRAALIALVLLAAACGSSSEKSSSTSADADVSAGASVFTSARCAAAVQDMTAASAKIGQAMTGQASDLEDTVEAFGALADAAPSEIKADMKVLADAYGSFVQAMADADITVGSVPSADAIEKLQDASEKFNATEVQAAAERVQTWFQTKCGK